MSEKIEKVNKKTREFKIKIGQVFKDEKRDLIITYREYRKDKYNQDWKWYKYTCNKCGWAEGWVTESGLLTQNTGCSCCHNRTVVEGINDIPTTAPWMVKYFQGGYDEAKLYTRCSEKRIYPICPDCGRVRNISVKIAHIYETKSIGCKFCGDGKSYPEKFISYILEQLNITFITELSKTIFKWCEDKRYDFYFKHNNEDYIIETHGMQHYKEGFEKIKSNKKARTVAEEQENDGYKKELALSNGINEENYIVIDCRKSELEFIKQNILNSRLSKIFDLNKVDWVKCEEGALSNLVKEVCEYKKNNPDITAMEIGKIFNLNRHTISHYLKRGTELEWCVYNAKEEKSKNTINNNKLKRKPIDVFKDGEYLKSFKSITECANMSESIFGITLYNQNISAVLSGKRKQHKGFTFEYST